MGNEKINSVEFDFNVYVTSHTGRVRDNNEDNFALNTISKKLEYQNVSFQTEMAQPFIAAVFDGMGGEDFGEIFLSSEFEILRHIVNWGCGSKDSGLRHYTYVVENLLNLLLD